jgi:hypothetical protein
MFPRRIESKPIAPPLKRQNTTRIDIPQIDYEAPSFPDLSPVDLWPRDRESVEAWVRTMNQDRTARLQIWSATKPYDNLTPNGPLPDPMYLRHIVKNTLVAFIVVSRKQNGDMAVEAINAFGPLERVCDLCDSSVVINIHSRNYLTTSPTMLSSPTSLNSWPDCFNPNLTYRYQLS